MRTIIIFSWLMAFCAAVLGCVKPVAMTHLEENSLHSNRFDLSSPREARLARLFLQLRAVKVKDMSFGSLYPIPYENDVERAIVAEGPIVIPYLTAELEHSGWDESVYIVLGLGTLEASNAKPNILRLENERVRGRFGHEPDGALYVQIRLFLREVDGWKTA